jgi:hypothetical protein
MIGTIRKHSTWMWGIIITATVISFVYWGSYTGGGGGGYQGGGNYGVILGQPIQRQEFVNTYREMEMRYRFSTGDWPGNDAMRSGFDPDRETYFRLLLLRKAAQLDIHASLDSVAKAANDMLRNANNGAPVSVGEFVKQALAPRGLTAADFERYLRHELIIQQLLSLAGSSGRLVTPQEARELYEREHQDYVTQAVFIHATNYAAKVTPTPAALGEFFTNQMSRYRIPERVTVSYVRFDVSNQLAEAIADLNQRTNLMQEIEMLYLQRGGTNYYTGKTPAEGQAEVLKEQQNALALIKTRGRANAIASVVMDSDPIRVESLAAVAATNGLKVEVSAPFAANEPPAGLLVGEEFVRTAHALTDAEPVAGPVLGQDAVYVIAKHSRLPSELPAYEQVKDRVTQDYTFYETAMAARAAGLNLATTVSNAIAGGKAFAAACAEAGFQPTLLPPFSLSSTNLPAIEQHANLVQFKQAMFMTPVGRASTFVGNNDGGGFVLYVQSKLPMDEAQVARALPDFMKSIRMARQNDAINLWVSSEGQRDPGFRDIMTGLAKRNEPAAANPAPLN